MVSEVALPDNSAVVEETDGALVARMARGDENAIGNLYDRYANQLFALALRIVGERADAEEVIMAAFAQAWRSAGSYDRTRGSVGAWLTMMVRSRGLDMGRSKMRRHRLTASGTPEETAGISLHQDDPSRVVELGDQRRRVEQALEQLPDAQRTAIRLAYYEGLTQSEIAARLDTPLGTIKTRIRDGMRALRDGLLPLHAEQGT